MHDQFPALILLVCAAVAVNVGHSEEQNPIFLLNSSFLVSDGNDQLFRMRIKLWLSKTISSMNLMRNIPADGNMKLELVQVLFRHGARTPIKEELQAINGNDESSYESLGLGALTKQGKKQMYDFGKFLRDRYSGFLDAHYKSEHVYAYSSDTNRTKMSLQLVLAGLYPPADDTIWNPNLMWSPVPYVYVPRQFDILLRSYANRRFRNLIRNSFKSRETKKRIAKNINFLREKTGIDFSGEFHNVSFAYGALASNESMNLPLPDWYTPEVKDTFKEAVGQVYDGYVSDLEMKKLGVGLLVKTFIGNMNPDEKFANPRKIYLYSGHDGNLAMFTRVHGIREFRCPGFGSAVILEKYRDLENRVHVKLLAWTEDGDLLQLPLNNYSECCPIDEYLKIFEPVVPTDDEVEKMLGTIEPVKLGKLFFSDNVVRKL